MLILGDIKHYFINDIWKFFSGTPLSNDSIEKLVSNATKDAKIYCHAEVVSAYHNFIGLDLILQQDR